MRIRRGFTLIEVLLAVALILALVTSLGVFVSQVSGSRQEIRARSERESTVTTMFDAVDDAVSTCIARMSDGASGISGDATTLAIGFDSTTIQRALEDDPERVLVPGGHLDIRFEPQSGRLSLTRDDDRMRTMPSSFFALRYRYHDGRSWRTEWDSVGMNGLPHAIECSVWFTPWPDEEIPAWFPDDYGDVLLDGADADGFDLFTEPDPFEGAFDSEDAGSERGLDADLFDEESLPEPDRRRIFAIPDADQPDESTFFDEPLLRGDVDSFESLESPTGVGGDGDG